MSEMEDNLLDVVFPVGKERWIKVKYLNLEKCITTFKLSSYIKPEEKEAKGYEITALSMREEFIPQAAALMDIRDEVVGKLAVVFEDLDDFRLVEIRDIFKSKIEELSKRGVKESR